ncbi:coiled-coil domain-containing protein 159 isoform X2 [Hyperolius riggenbachi]|uniref:coiled-coil domain-containing protein 159 isoform X2 n=1 Tax=Hyperolius riggenbachi TaxID=752182 RepID=UPI0035A33790
MSWETQGRLYNRGETIAGGYRFDSPQVLRPLYEDTSPKPSSPYLPSTYSAAAASPEDLVTLSSQLLSQAKMITSLHQAIGRLERDRDHHLQRIQGLEEEVRRLSAARGDVTESLLDRKVEGLRQELSSELRHLQDRVREPSPRVSSPSLRSTSSVLQEVNENKRLIWKEYESLRRDMDYLHQRLRRQEDDLLRHLSDGQELKRAQERNTSALEGLKCSHQMQVQEVSRTRSDTQDMQRNLLQIRSMIADLKEEMRHLEGKRSARTSRSDRVERTKSARKQKVSKSTSLSSSEDEHSQLSLADISSEETSYSLSVPTVSRGSRDRSSHSREWRTNSNQSDKDVSDDLDEFSDSPPELNFSDL